MRLAARLVSVGFVSLAALLQGCASERPEDQFQMKFDSSAGYVEVEVLGDGFVRTGGRRIPLDAFVLELRQLARAMTEDELGRFVVRIRRPAGAVDGASALTASNGLNRLLLELDIMDVGQVVVL